MKKVFLVAVVLFSISFAQAQKQVVKINPLSMAFGFFNATYETLVSESSSVEIGAGLISKDGVTGYDFRGRYKMYFTKSTEAPRGVYAAPMVGFSGITDGSDKLTMFRGGADVGYQFVFGGGDSGFALDVYAGIKYVSLSGNSTVFNDGVGGSFGLAIGYAW